jgi:hypothetical protein
MEGNEILYNQLILKNNFYNRIIADGKDSFLPLEFRKIMDTMYPVKQDTLGILYTNSKSLSAFGFTG